MIYCLRCKKSTPTKSEFKTKTKNGKLRIGGKCSICGASKSKFVSK